MNSSFYDAIQAIHAKDIASHSKALLQLLKLIQDSSTTKEKIIARLTKETLFTIYHFTNNSPEETVRTFAAKLLCEFAYQNPYCQARLCELFGFTHFQGKVVINKWPEQIRVQLKCTPTLLYQIKKTESVPGSHYWCYPEFVTETSNGNSYDFYWCNVGNEFGDSNEKFPDPKHYLIGFNECGSSKTRDSSKAAFFSTQKSISGNTDRKFSSSPPTKLNNKTLNLVGKLVTAYYHKHPETKPNRTHTAELSSRKTVITPQKMHKDIEKLYRKDILPSSPTRLKYINFSDYSHFIQGFHKLSATRKKSDPVTHHSTLVSKKIEEERRRSLAKPKINITHISNKPSPIRKHTADANSITKVQKPVRHRQPNQAKKKVDELILSFIKEGIGSKVTKHPS